MKICITLYKVLQCYLFLGEPIVVRWVSLLCPPQAKVHRVSN